MDEIKLIVEAITLGAAASGKDVASKVVNEAYEGLKSIVGRRFKGDAAAEAALADAESNPQASIEPLTKALTEHGLAKDEEILSLARTVVYGDQFIVGQAEGSAFGDHASVTHIYQAGTSTRLELTYWVGRPASLGKGFYGRADDLEAVASAFKDRRAVVVSGGAGSGKSQLAAEHAHADNVQGFWTSGEAAADSNLAGLASAFGLTVEGKSDDEVATEAQRRLAALPAETLWVIDNLPDLGLVNALLNTCGGVRLLITTRDSQHNLLSSSVAFRRIEVLDPDPAIDLLGSRSRTSHDRDQLGRIAKQVGYLPLALEVLAARLGEPRQTTGKVLAELEKAPTIVQMDAFRKAVGTSIPRAEGVFSAIVRTLESLSAEDREALGGLAYIADEPVPDALAAALTGVDDDGLTALLSECSRQSIISWADGRVRIHALTVAALAATNPEGSLAGAVKQAQRRLATINQDDPISLRAEIVHHEAVYSCARTGLPAGQESVLSFGNSLAIGYTVLGRIEDAIRVHERNLEAFERVMGLEHRNTLTIRSNLTVAYRAVGRIGDAIELDGQTLEARERVLGLEHPETLKSRNNLANRYRHAGRKKDAIRLHEQTLGSRERALGQEHPDTLSSRVNLAASYLDDGRPEDAIRLLEPTFDHPETLKGRNNLAASYSGAGRVGEAIDLFKQTLEGQERVLGPKHPDTVRSRSNLAISYREAGRDEDAERLESGTDE